MVAAAKKLGLGIYTPRDAAFFARVRTQTLTRWIHGSGTGNAAVRAEFPDDAEKTITFKDFVQALAIRDITKRPGVSLQKIRKAVDAIAEKGIDYPLARRHRTFVITDGSQAGELVIELDERLIQVTGRKRDQTLIGPIAELYLDKVTFDAKGDASLYTAWSDKNGTILMDPHIRFGRPIVKGCGYSAEQLYEACIVEGSLDGAADAYGVTREDVACAYAFIDFLMGAA